MQYEPLQSDNITAVDLLYEDQKYSATKWWPRKSPVFPDDLVLEVLMPSTQLGVFINAYRETHGNYDPPVTVLLWRKENKTPYILTNTFIADIQALKLTFMGLLSTAAYEMISRRHPFIANLVRELQIEADEREDPDLNRFRQLMED